MTITLASLVDRLTAQPLLDGDFRLTDGAEDRTDELSEMRFANPVTVPYLDPRRAAEAVLAGDVVLWVRTAVANKRLGGNTFGGRWLLLAARGARLRVRSPRRSIARLTVHTGAVEPPHDRAGLPVELGYLIEGTVTGAALVAEVDHVVEHRDDAYLGLPLLPGLAAVPPHWHLRDPAEIARLLLESIPGT